MQVLMYKPSYDRLRGRIAAELPGLSVATIAEDGTPEVAVESGYETVAPTMAWADLNLYDSPAVRDFMVCCLKAKSLTFFQSGGAGLDHPVFGMLAERGVELANSDANCISVAEYAMGCAFHAFQPIEQRRALQQTRTWEATPARELFGSTWVVVGMGAIGRAITLRAQACGARVTGVRRTPRVDDPADRMVSPAGLSDAVIDADVVVLCAAANPDNTNMIDAALLARLSTRSVFINVARGSLVDEQALLSALDRGAPMRAYLDVFAQEPLPSASPLWDHPRVRMSAHCAGSSAGATRRNDDLFIDNARRLLAGDRPLRVVPMEQVMAMVVQPESRG